MTNGIKLYNHNVKIYKKVKAQFNESNVVSIIQATGTGKSYVALQLAYDNKDKKIIYVVPYNSIVEHLKNIIKENNLLLIRDFPNLEFRTYQSFINMSDEELSNLDVNLLILDEFHHIGAPVWGNRINTIIKNHQNIRVFGMTAYNVRDRGTPFERDMTNSETNELFSNTVVSTYDLCDAMIDGVLPKPVYKSAYVRLEQTISAIEQKVDKLNHKSLTYQELTKLIIDAKKRIHEAPSIKDVFKINIKKDGKYIYFCPINAENGINDIKTIQKETKKWIEEMGLRETDYEFYTTTSLMGEEGYQNRLSFYNDKDLHGNKVNNKLRIMFAINQYNEGVHVPKIDGVIMGRGTKSDIVFFEQLGRALSVRGKTKEEYDKLYSMSIEELEDLCIERKIEIGNTNFKERMIEKILSPTIIDLTNNIEFIEQLENDLRNRIREISNNTKGEKRVNHLENASFDINILNKNIFEIIKYMIDRLTMSWEEKYNLAKIYYEKYGNLEVQHGFRTTNGYDYDENGIALGYWINTQRMMYKKNELSEDRVEMLKKIGMRFDTVNVEYLWKQNYNLAKAYYEKYGNLEIPQGFKTINGYEYDKNGIAIGRWLSKQRMNYKTKKMPQNRIKMLEKIGMCFDILSLEDLWKQNYNLAKAYYEKYGNLEISQSFKTINGCDYDERGIALGNWINNQRKMYKKNKLSEDRAKMLEKIGMRFDILSLEDLWMQNYNLAKSYYEKYGNLNMPWLFKTTNGYDYDENGINLWHWINTLRQAYNGKNKCKLTKKRIEMLEKIGMRFDTINVEYLWQQNYNLAKSYYEKYGNLEIPQGFKTINGYDYDENGIAIGRWLSKQRLNYKEKKMT